MLFRRKKHALLISRTDWTAGHRSGSNLCSIHFKQPGLLDDLMTLLLDDLLPLLLDALLPLLLDDLLPLLLDDLLTLLLDELLPEPSPYECSYWTVALSRGLTEGISCGFYCGEFNENSTL